MNYKKNNGWYLVQFKKNSHNIALQNLKRQGLQTFLPLIKNTKRKCSKFVNDIRPLFPGYLFVNFDLEVFSWNKITLFIN